jgi:4-hydroxybenzoyl-CoA thioesterase
MLVNTRVFRIEWGDCDPAGIIYYPRYLAIFDACTTALIERALGMGKRDYLKVYDFAGHLLVDVRCRFLLPTRFGDDVTIETTVSEFRRSSFDLRHRLTLGTTLAAEGFETRVWVKGHPPAGAIKAAPVPKQVVEALSGPA